MDACRSPDSARWGSTATGCTAASMSSAAVTTRSPAGPWAVNEAEVDLLVAEHALVVEADDARFHDHPLARERDARKQAALEAAGYRVARLAWRDVTRDASGAARRLGRICAVPPKRAA